MKLAFCAVLGIMLFQAYGCNKNQAHPGNPQPCGHEVIISLANEDRLAPAVMMDVDIDGRSVFHGPLQATQAGDYLYLSTVVPQRGVVLKVRSQAGSEIVEQERSIWVKDRLWLVITRVREFDGEPELSIEASYENPWDIGE